MPRYDMIVIGTSTGGVEALMQLIHLLPNDFPTPLFVAIHLSRNSESRLDLILTRIGQMPAVFPKDGEKAERSHIYIAPPNRHMLIENGSVRLSDGPREN